MNQRWGLLLSVLAAFSTGIFQTTDLLAQSTSDDLQKIRLQYGLDPNGEHARRLISGEHKQLRLRRENGELELKVTQHIRGTSGIEIGPPLPIPEKLLTPDEKVLARITGEFFERMRQDVEEKLLVQRIPDCFEERTERFNTGVKPPADGVSRVISDVLLLREGKAPSDPTALYGDRIEVREVSDKKATAASLIAREFKVECLPMRFRLTSRYAYRHRGKDALKNFEEDQDGKGVYVESSIR